MPNHIINTIRLKGDREKISELLESVKDNRFGIGSLDFNKVIPMPESLQIETSSSIICNEESKLIGMEGNRRIGDGSSIIAGPFFICGTTEEDFRGLTDSEVDLYMDRFKEPEQISQEEVNADTRCTIIFSM